MIAGGRIAAVLPNALTVTRVLLVPPLVALVLQSVTTFGKIGDPIADKLLVGAALVSLVAVGRLAAAFAAVAGARARGRTPS